MPRRSGRNTDTQVTETNSTEAVVSPKKGRVLVKVEAAAEVVTKVEEPSPAKSLRKKVKAEIASESESLDTAPKALADIKTKQKAPKRKAKTEDGDEDEDAHDKKTPKKRKTKGEKEAEAMPLAVRTVIATLKHAMHIGAHVSGAGGEFP